MALLKSQKNFQIHVLITVLVILLAAWLHISPIQWALLILSIAMVLAAEAINTSIEMVIDLHSSQRSWPAKFAKDVAAATVLIVCAGAAGVGLLVLGPPLYERFLNAI